MKKNVIIAVILVACLVWIYFTWQFFKHRSQQEQIDNQTKVEMIQDSLIHLSEQEELHRDSAQFYHEEHDKTYQHYLTAMADTSVWAELRTRYRSNLRTEIRAGLTGHGDSL